MPNFPYSTPHVAGGFATLRLYLPQAEEHLLDVRGQRVVVQVVLQVGLEVRFGPRPYKSFYIPKTVKSGFGRERDAEDDPESGLSSLASKATRLKKHRP